MKRVKPRLRAMVKEANATKADVQPLEVSTIAERNPNVDSELAIPYMGTLTRTPTPISRKTTDAHKHVKAGKDIKPRNRCIALSPCVVTKADGTTYEIAASRNVSDAKKRAKKAAEVSRVMPEVSKIAFKDAKQLFGS